MNKEEAKLSLAKLIHTINTQDNRATASPYYYVIRTEKWRVAHADYSSGHTRRVWVDWNGDPTTYLSKKEFMSAWLLDRAQAPEVATEEELAEFKAARERAVEEGLTEFEKLEEFTEERYFEEENVFFTYEGYEEHVRLNGHNLGKMGKDYHSYVKHAFRNPELKQMFEAIGVLVDVPWGVR